MLGHQSKNMKYSLDTQMHLLKLFKANYKFNPGNHRNKLFFFSLDVAPGHIVLFVYNTRKQSQDFGPQNVHLREGSFLYNPHPSVNQAAQFQFQTIILKSDCFNVLMRHHYLSAVFQLPWFLHCITTVIAWPKYFFRLNDALVCVSQAF